MIVKQTVSLLAALVSVFDVYVGMTFSLAFQRRGSGAVRGLRRLATTESSAEFQAAPCDANTLLTFPGLERPG